MNALLAEVLEAHGGWDRWRAVRALTASGSFGGLLQRRLPGNRMADVEVGIEAGRQDAVFEDFPRVGQRVVFGGDEVRLEEFDGHVLESRKDARRVFSGLTGLRRNFRWDCLDAGYFAGYAWWNYLTSPFLLAQDGVEVTDGGPWTENGNRWRRLRATFPPGFHTHSVHQTFYVDAQGLIRRHDYVAEPVGRWAHAAHYCENHKTFGGIVFPTRRRVYPRLPGGRSMSWPVLVALDIDNIEISVT
jgi:hypothetical protein